MILLFCQLSNLGHEREGICEVSELKLLIERTINFLPRFSHPPTLDGTNDGQLVEWRVTRNSTMIAGIKRWSLARTSRGEFGRQCRAHVATSVKTTT